MNKIITSESNEELVRRMGVLISLVDPHQMRKVATSDSMGREMLQGFKPDRDHFLMHVIGLGDLEAYSFNRNADGFSKKANQTYHDTFVKHAHFFREHNNSNPSLKIGDVKASIHNGPMSRVELAVWGHKKLASDVHDRLAEGKPVSVSMACKIAWDRDNCTGKKCRSPHEYEPHMKTRPGQYIPEFQKYAFVHNDHPDFFDISYVARPADRIAHFLDYILKADDAEVQADFQKAASAGGPIPGAFLAEAMGIHSPDDVWGNDTLIPERRILLEKLAATEGDVEIALLHPDATSDFHNFVKHAAVFAFRPGEEISTVDMNLLRTLQPETFFREMNKRAALLPFRSFVAYATGKPLEEVTEDENVKRASLHLPQIFRSMIGNILPVIDDGMFEPHGAEFMSRVDPANTDEVQKLFNKVEAQHGAHDESAGRRTISICIEYDGKKKKDRPKSEEETEESEEKTEKEAAAKKLAGLYGSYLLTSLHHISKNSDKSLDNQGLVRVVSRNFN